MIRRFGEAIRPDIQYRLRPGVYAILPRDGALLTTFQEAPRPEYQLPGGGIDKGEQPIAALHREVFEETGWSISRPVRVGAYRRFCYMEEYDLWAEKLCTIYIARPILRLGPPLEAGHEATWLGYQEALDRLANAGERDMLHRILKYKGQL